MFENCGQFSHQFGVALVLLKLFFHGLERRNHSWLMNHASKHVIVVGFDAVALSPVVKVAIEVSLIMIKFGVLLWTAVSCIQFAEKTPVLLSYIIFHFLFHLLPAGRKPLEISLLLMLILVPSSSEGVRLPNIFDFIEVELEGLFLHVDICYFGLSLRVEHANKYIYR